MSAAQQATAMSDGDALAMLLTVDGFILAGIALAVTVSAPNQLLPPRHPSLKPDRIINGALGVMAVMALGSLVAWCRIFTGGSWEGFSRAGVAVSLLIAIAAQPIFALLIALSARRALPDLPPDGFL